MDVEFSALRLLDLVAVAVPARGEGLPVAARILDVETADVARRLAEYPAPPRGDDAPAAHPGARRLEVDALVLAAEREVARAREERPE